MEFVVAQSRTTLAGLSHGQNGMGVVRQSSPIPSVAPYTFPPKNLFWRVGEPSVILWGGGIKDCRGKGESLDITSPVFHQGSWSLL